MFSTPDLPTLSLCSLLASSAYAVIFMVLWGRRRRDTYLLDWGASSAIYALALIGFAFGYGLPPWGNNAVGHGIVASSDLLILSGMRRFDGRRPFPAWMLIPLAATMIGATLPPAVAPGQPGALLVSRVLGSAMLGACMLICAAGIMAGRWRSASLPRRIVALTLLAYIPGYLISIGMQIYAPMRANFLALVPMLQDQVLLGSLNLALLATPWERAQRALRESALRDGLTGVWNRTALKQHEAELARPANSLLLIDIDHFKTVNDTYGHAAGDAVLIAFASRIQALAVERGGVFVRLGGDEFVLIAPTADDAAACSLAEQVRFMPDPVVTGLPPYSISIGLARVNRDDAGLSLALARADRSLYRAKASGRDQVAA